MDVKNSLVLLALAAALFAGAAYGAGQDDDAAKAAKPGGSQAVVSQLKKINSQLGSINASVDTAADRVLTLDDEVTLMHADLNRRLGDLVLGNDALDLLYDIRQNTD